MVGYAIALVCAVKLAADLVHQSQQLRQLPWRLGWAFAAAVVCVMLGQIAIAGISHGWLRSLGVPARRRDVLRVHLSAQPLKYLPAGGAFNIAGQMAGMGRLPGARASLGALGVVLMQVTVAAGSVTWFGLTEFAADRGSVQSGLTLFKMAALPAAMVACSRPMVLRTIWARLRGKSADDSESSPAPTAARLAGMSAMSLSAWALLGGSVVFLVCEMQPDAVTWETAIRMTGALSGAWLIGFVAVVAPAGLGVRELALAFFLRPLLPEPLPVLVAILSRLSWISADVLNLVAVRLLFRVGRTRRQAETEVGN